MYTQIKGGKPIPWQKFIDAVDPNKHQAQNQPDDMDKEMKVQ